MVSITTADDAMHRSRSHGIAQMRLKLGQAIVANWGAARRLANALVRNGDKADDVLQDATCRALEYAHTFDWSRPVGPWFLRIVRNTALTSIRRSKATCELTELAGPGGVEDEVLGAEERRALQNAFEMLPPRYRQVLHLRYYREFEYKAISDTLHIPLGTTKILLHRARREIRVRYGGGGAIARTAVNVQR